MTLCDVFSVLRRLRYRRSRKGEFLTVVVNNDPRAFADVSGRQFTPECRFEFPLQKLREPCGLVHIYTDTAGVYNRHLPASAHTIGKLNTQQIERKHFTLRTRITRLARQTLGFSKSVLYA